jgi:hypothetical protein
MCKWGEVLLGRGVGGGRLALLLRAALHVVRQQRGAPEGQSTTIRVLFSLIVNAILPSSFAQQTI